MLISKTEADPATAQTRRAGAQQISTTHPAAPPAIRGEDCFKGANAGKSPHLPPQSPAAEAANNSSVGATCMEDFVMWSSACWD